jgi:hypothetical protein
MAKLQIESEKQTPFGEFFQAEACPGLFFWSFDRA